MRIFFVVLSCIITQALCAQTPIWLYDSATIPNAKLSRSFRIALPELDTAQKVNEVVDPTLTVFLPEKNKANGTAVIICPGGGYRYLSFQKEGCAVARVLAQWGVAAFVLKYRLPSDSTMEQKEIGPLQDAQRAIQLVRQRAAAFNIKANQVGIMGFSAGGHLASTAGTHFKKAQIANPTRTNLRPDFMALIYPVISFSDSITHKGSRTRLLGDNASTKAIRLFSNEQQVTRHTPPTFLVHAKDDKVVPVMNSLLMDEKLRSKGVSSTLYLYEKGGHGFGMKNATSPVLWMDQLQDWMRSLSLLQAK